MDKSLNTGWGARVRKVPCSVRAQAKPRDDRGSIVMVLFIIITASILVLAAAGIAISQEAVATRTVQSNDALQAAHGGLDAAISEIRAASNGSGGQVEELPCTGGNGFTLTGTVGPSTTATYTVTVAYYDGAYPPTLNQVALDTAVACFSNMAGSYPSQVPNWAVITSTGQDPESGHQTPPKRELQEVYAFLNTNLDVPGGSIEDFDYTTDDLCMIDPAATPAAGDTVYMETCQESGTNPDQYTWSYETNEDIELSATATSATPLCLYGNVNNKQVSLAACSTSSSLWWGITNSAGLMPETSGGAQNTQNLCLNENGSTSPIPLNLATCTGSFDQAQSWKLTHQVGAGQAGSSTYQYVNYADFGYCLDVTNQTVTPPEPYLILYECKQFEDGAGWNPTSGQTPEDPIWNQRFVPYGNYTYNGSSYQLLETPYTTSESTSYCLYSPFNTSDGATDPAGDNPPNGTVNNPSWVTVAACPTINGTPSAAQSHYLWSINTSTTYNITDAEGDCLDADNADQQIPSGDVGGAQYVTATVAVCDTTSEYEKWNAPPTVSNPGVSDVFEPILSGN